MKAYLSRRYRISASHRLHTPEYSGEVNRLIYGKCNHPHGHGHNYVLEVTVSGQVDSVTGMVCDLEQLDGCVRKYVLERFDYTNLNVDPAFSQQVPTTENLCMTIHSLLSSQITGASLEGVRLEETSNNFFEFQGRAGKA